MLSTCPLMSVPADLQNLSYHINEYEFLHRTASSCPFCKKVITPGLRSSLRRKTAYYYAEFHFSLPIGIMHTFDEFIHSAEVLAAVNVTFRIDSPENGMPILVIQVYFKLRNAVSHMELCDLLGKFGLDTDMVCIEFKAYTGPIFCKSELFWRNPLNFTSSTRSRGVLPMFVKQSHTLELMCSPGHRSAVNAVEAILRPTD